MYTEEQMTPDPPPPAPSFKTVELDTVEAEKQQPRHQSWFDQNKVTRVPLIALENDLYKIPNQAYACFSMIKPEEYGKCSSGDKEHKGYLIKFRGCFPSKELAVRHVEKLMTVDRHFDIHLIPAFQWSSIEDDTVEDREYANKMISDIMKGYFREENNRMLGIRDRIRNTEEDKDGSRSLEATSFYDEAQAQEMANKLGSLEIVDEAPKTLDEIAREHEVTAKANVLAHEHRLGYEQTKEVISQIILD